ncbi:hypothetical protein CEXT_175591 [Caerostris extrusa]|uniref:Uncharacterized protein n=1 Tax=Caerostris extrusa TaxID=172846 RepID=A0AAV4T8S8_CAEEX|nr:hypothetical protein CEXT_175591 [Caerostris extrusa]
MKDYSLQTLPNLTVTQWESKLLRRFNELARCKITSRIVVQMVAVAIGTGYCMANSFSIDNVTNLNENIPTRTGFYYFHGNHHQPDNTSWKYFAVDRQCWELKIKPGVEKEKEMKLPECSLEVSLKLDTLQRRPKTSKNTNKGKSCFIIKLKKTEITHLCKQFRNFSLFPKNSFQLSKCLITVKDTYLIIRRQTFVFEELSLITELGYADYTVFLSFLHVGTFGN